MTPEDIKSVVAMVTEEVTYPLRRPSYQDPSFWAIPLTLTKALPVPAGGGWVDFLEIPRRDGHKIVIKEYTADGMNSGVFEFRWIVGGMLKFAPTPGPERHLDRAALNPYPASPRETFILATANQRVVLQARNTSVAEEQCFAQVYGWYYPSLHSPNEFTAQEGIDDQAR